MERRMMAVERRPVFALGSLGPNIAPMAKQIVDWNSDEAMLNGWVWTDINSLNGPNQTRVWIGMSINTTVGHGMQLAWSHDETLLAPQQYVRTYHKTDLGAIPLFSAWTLV
jgi:hypothetical protein